MSNEATKTDYKESLNLPQTTLAMRANATVRELEKFTLVLLSTKFLKIF